jgi:hypothetical protein
MVVNAQDEGGRGQVFSIVLEKRDAF